MNGPHDVGGRAGFGDVAPDPHEPLFHNDWERRVLGITLCCGALGHWKLDESRHSRERLPPALYYSSSYYRIWLEALQNLLLEHGEITAEELRDGQLRKAGKASASRLAAERVAGVLATGAPTIRDAATPPRFSVGDPVRTLVDHQTGHTRLPAYARDKQGVVAAVHEPHVFPDTSAHGLGEHAQWLYTVAFDGHALWGRGAEPDLVISIDAWESYLESA